ncbi:MAG: LysE family translocator [Xanthobacteraceae bacterium]|nr:MAG: LysE family translocator [Xanthobacteraceae bacterium]
MQQQLFVAFMMFAVAALFTPGPNNAMLMTSGVNFGLRRTMPHILGVAIGFAFLQGLVGLGLGVVFKAYPWLYTLLKYAGAAYLAWLAWQIAHAEPDSGGGGETAGRPMTFFGAALFQWVNVKGWIVAIGATTAYAAIAIYPWNIALQVSLLAVVGMCSATTWVLFGTVLRPWLASARAVRIFNWGMALALVASLYPVLTEG